MSSMMTASGWGGRSKGRKGERFGPRVIHETPERLTILGLVEAGSGVSIAPESFRMLRWGADCYKTLAKSSSRATLGPCVLTNNPLPASIEFLRIAELAPGRR